MVAKCGKQSVYHVIDLGNVNYIDLVQVIIS